MKIFYRISDGGYNKQKLDFATKPFCLDNFLYVFQHWPENNDSIYILMDGCSEHTENSIRDVIFKWNKYYNQNIEIEHIHGGSSAQSFKITFDKALTLNDNEIVLFQEDDYLHLLGAREVYLEGLSHVEYCTAYCHPDKFIPAKLGGNPEVDDSGCTTTAVFKTKSSYWMLVNSATMTFATRVKTLKEDKDIWIKHISDTYPRDYEAFLELRETKKRTVAQPIPTFSTHTEIGWLASTIGTSLLSWDDLNEERPKTLGDSK